MAKLWHVRPNIEGIFDDVNLLIKYTIDSNGMVLYTHEATKDKYFGSAYLEMTDNERVFPSCGGKEISLTRRVSVVKGLSVCPSHFLLKLIKCFKFFRISFATLIINEEFKK